MPFGARLFAMAATFALSTTLSAQSPGTRQIRDFVQAAAQTDEFELLEANTALAESKDQQVRSYAQAMIDAHRQTTASLRDAVARSGLDQPNPGVSGDQSSFLASLQSQRGAEFDKVYIRQQILVHRAALATQQEYARSGDNPAVRQVASTMVPIVSSHLQMAEKIASGGS
jgi:putative membrane protein